MHQSKFITNSELSAFGPVESLNQMAATLVEQQKDAWELAGTNYLALSQVQTNSFDFGDFHILVQYNPGRMRSSSAKTADHIISRRPCFLCHHNLPGLQKGIPYLDRYLIVANPYPIFPIHLTIPLLEHLPQKLGDHFSDMLSLSEDLTDFTIFYNGPRCGASAPDHFHFQAGNRGFLPIEREFYEFRQKNLTPAFRNKNLQIFAINAHIRKILAFVSPEKEEIATFFKKLYDSLYHVEGEEPMMNILTWHEDNFWYVILFPREKQRPSHFYKTTMDQIIIGPAAVEMGGVLILPRQEDFKRMDHKLIGEIYSEVTASQSRFKHWIKTAGDVI